MKSVVTQKAFTIVELLVAMALVVILAGLSSLIFAAGVKAHRTADSTVEIVRRAESVSRQLVDDFGGLRASAPLAVWFERVGFDTNGDSVIDTYRRYDQILFFANGNFQTLRQYNNQPVRGNLARVYYGHAWQVQTDAAANPTAFTSHYRQSGLLSRRTHLLTSDTTLSYPGVPNPFPNATQFATSFIPYNNNRSEYDQLSLSEWKNLMLVQENCIQVLLRSFVNLGGSADYDGRPMIDMGNSDTLHLLLAEHISEFKIQWGFTSSDLTAGTFTDIRWWPDAEADDFSIPGGINKSNFGVYFNMPGGENLPDWYPVSACKHQVVDFSPAFFPRAFKITFTVHDAKGLFPEGRTFTQIIYLD